MSTRRISKATFILILLVLLFTPSVLAQTYAFSLDSETVNVYWESDGTLSLAYEFVFTNAAYADPLDFIDVGMPTSSFYLSNAYAEVNGVQIYHIANSPYVTNGIELGLGSSAIQPGTTGSVRFQISGIQNVLYIDSDDDNYASAVFSPTWFDSEFVSGSTDLTVIYHLPPGVGSEEGRWHKAPSGWSEEPFPSFDEQGRVTYSWRNSSANGYTQYLFGASFPASYVPASAISKPTFWQNIGIDPEALLGGACICGVILFFIGIPILSIRGAQKRKLQYLPPKIAIEGHGIKRGLTSVEAAVLLEQPMDKIFTMILFSVIKKNAAKVTKHDPLVLEITDPIPADLRPYEVEFLEAMREQGNAKQKRGMQETMINLVKSVSKAMKGFSRNETKKYYEKIIETAWNQVESSDTPVVRSENYDKVMEWTMLDDNYDDRTRRAFQNYPVFLPMWWHNYSPASTGPTIQKTGAPTSRPTPGGTRMAQLPGAEFAASVVTGVEKMAGGVIGSVSDFTSGVTQKTNPVPKASSSGSFRSGGSSGGSSCACACACAGCACACAGGGR